MITLSARFLSIAAFSTLLIGLGIQLATMLKMNNLPVPVRRYVVLFAVNNECPLSRQYAGTIASVVRDYAPAGFEFIMLAVNNDSLAPLFRNQAMHHLTDRDGRIAAAWAIRKVPSALIAETGHYGMSGVVYRGAIDDWAIALGKHRKEVNNHYLRSALDALIQGKQPSPAFTKAIGCYTEEFR